MKLIIVSLIVAFLLNVVTSYECGKSFNINHWKRQIQLAKQNIKSNKILGGDVAPAGSWPWVIQSNGVCTGSIIHENWVISAKHCAKDEMYITHSSHYDGKGTRVEVEEQFVYGDAYNGTDESVYYTDIMLLKLNESIQFSEFVNPICLSRSIPKNTGEFDVAAGFGVYVLSDENHQGTYYEPSPYLRESIIPLRSEGEDYGLCIELPYGPKCEICGGSYEKGTTPGDSGGPLMALIDDKWYLHGITSRGKHAYSEFDPETLYGEDIFTDVTAFCDWIKATTNGDVECH